MKEFSTALKASYPFEASSIISFIF